MAPVEKVKEKKSKHRCDDGEKKAKKRKHESCSEEKSPKKSKKSKHAPAPESPVEELDVLDINRYRISDSVKQCLKAKGIEKLTPIQAATFDKILNGSDAVGRARTGTGKTLSFALPIVESLTKTSVSSRYPRVIVLCPTRELARQVSAEFASISPTLRVLTVYGGVPYADQERGLRNGIDIIVGTPGRVIDHLDRGNINLSSISFAVLDEADQMLDIGFADAMERILQAIKTTKPADSYQTLLFSATLPVWIDKTIQKYLRRDNMIKVDLVKDQTLKTSETIKHFAIECSWHQRKSTIGDIIRVYGGGNCGRSIIFTDTKQEANDIALGSDSMEGIECQVLHGDIPQKQREITLAGFREGKFRVLVATDVAARGLDIPEVDLVVQSQIPKDIDTFVHRSGRTGRAGKKGVNIAFYKPMEEWGVKNVERKLGFVFVRIGAPQPDSIMKVKAEEAIKSLGAVNASVLPIFKQTVCDLLSGEIPIGDINVEDQQEFVENLLARTLAVMTGVTKPPPTRSLLSCRENMTALAIRLDHEVRSSGYVRNILTRQLPEVDREEFKAFRMFKDMRGSVFEVDSSKVQDILSKWQERVTNPSTVLEIVTELPELEQRDTGHPQSSGRGNFGASQNRGFGGTRGGRSYGNSSASRGRGGYSRQSW